jgi:hypothetical protein
MSDRAVVRAMGRAEMRRQSEEDFARSLWHREAESPRLGDTRVGDDHGRRPRAALD